MKRACRFSPRCEYVQPKCITEEPPLLTAEHAEHVYACWYPVGSPVYREKRAQLDKAKQKAGTAQATTSPIGVG